MSGRANPPWWRSPLVRIDAAGASVLLLASGLAYAFGINPYLRRSEGVAVLRAELEQTRESIDSARAALKASEEKRAGLEGRRSSAPLVLSPVSQLNERMTRLAEIARSPVARLKLQETVASVPKPEARYTTVPVRLSGSGSYVGFSGFLSQLHEQFRDMRVTSMKIADNPGAPGSPAVFSVELVWYAAPRSAESRAARDGERDRAGASAEK